MSAYLARLKNIDTDYFTKAPYTEPTEPTKEGFDGFVGEGMRHIVKNNTDIEIIQLNNDSKKCTICEPSKPSKVPFEPFEGTGTGHIEKKITDDVEIIALPEPSATAKPETLLDRQREARRKKVIAMLESAPGTQRAIYTDTDSDPYNVILTIAVRACQQTCEMLIPKDKYAPWRLLEFIERYGQVTH